MSEAPQPGEECLRPLPEGCELWVQVVPNASRTTCAGLHDGALRVRLAAPPLDGRANATLLKWIAESLGLPRRAVTLAAGHASRRKRVRIELSTADVARWLRARLAECADPAP